MRDVTLMGAHKTM